MQESSSYPWCTPRSLEELTAHIEELPVRLPVLPILVQAEPEAGETALALTDDFPCPTCPSRSACQKDYAVASKLRQEQHRHVKSIQALRASLWHRFQERVEVLQRFGYLTPTAHLTDDGEWARLIRIDHSLLITELIRADAFTSRKRLGASGLMRFGSPPKRCTASRIAARSMTQGTPVKSCMITRAGVNAISCDGAAFGSHFSSASTSSRVTLTPSSVRKIGRAHV